MNRIAAIAIAVVVAAGGIAAFSYFGEETPVSSAPAPDAANSPQTAEAPAPDSSAQPTTQTADLPATPDILPQRILGREDAPVTILEFSSLTCGHCGNFHRETLPKLKETYIDTGKARLVYRDFPIGQLALVAAMLPHCAGGDRYFGFLDVLFRSQETWATSQNPLNEIAKIVRMGGMSMDELQACLDNQALFDALRDRAIADGDEFGIDATPTFIINGEKIVGNQSPETFRQMIDDALAGAN